MGTDIIHCDSSIAIAHDPDSTGCRIPADQVKWLNCDDKTKTIFEKCSASGNRTRIRRSIGALGTINVNDDVSLHKRVEATKMTCFWVMEDDINENNDNECLPCRERFATFADLRWHLADSTTDDHNGFPVKITYSLDGHWCQIDVSKRHYPEDTQSYRHGFEEVLPDGLGMWQTITEARPGTCDKLKRHQDTHIPDGAAISVAQNIIEQCLNPAKNLYNRDKPSMIALGDNRLGQGEWFCKECRKKGYSRSESSAADNDNGRDKLDYDDDGDEKKRGHSNRPTACDPNDSTESSAQDSRGKSREKSPNPQPRKKRRVANYIEATVAQDVILAYDADLPPARIRLWLI